MIVDYPKCTFLVLRMKTYFFSEQIQIWIFNEVMLSKNYFSLFSSWC